jgi:hypothetical protein
MPPCPLQAPASPPLLTYHRSPAGTEPWRTLPGFKLPVRLEQDLSHDAKKALAACREAYYRRYRKASWGWAALRLRRQKGLKRPPCLARGS